MIQAPAADGLTIVYRKIGELLPYAKNPRKHDAENIETIKALLLEYGWTNPMLLDGAKGILAGHGRVIAAKQIIDGGTIKRCPGNQIPTVDLHGFTAEQKRAYVIADNASAEKSGWDTTLLSGELGELELAGFDLSLTAIEDDDLAKAAKPGKGGGVREVDVSDVRDRFWISIRGPLKAQAKALKAMRAACAEIEGVEVEVELGTIADETL